MSGVSWLIRKVDDQNVPDNIVIVAPVRKFMQSPQLPRNLSPPNPPKEGDHEKQALKATNLTSTSSSSTLSIRHNK